MDQKNAWPKAQTLVAYRQLTRREAVGCLQVLYIACIVVYRVDAAPTGLGLGGGYQSRIEKPEIPSTVLPRLVYAASPSFLP